MTTIEINTLVECRDRAVERLMSAKRACVLRTLPGGMRAWILESARAVWEREGLRIIGAANTAERAAQMQETTSIRTLEISALLDKLDAGAIALDKETVVVLDAIGVEFNLSTRLRSYIDRAATRFVRIEDGHI